MKSIEVIQKEIKQIIELNENERRNRTEQKPSVITRRKKRIQFLKICEEYLKSNPTKDFLEKEEERISNRVTVIETSFNRDSIDPSLKVKKTRRGFASKTEVEIIKDYYKLMGVPVLKEQLKSIRFLLN